MSCWMFAFMVGFVAGMWYEALREEELDKQLQNVVQKNGREP